ncbi:hypothetical protein NL676_039878 [Syzygium grande]|nr:hypothetical protein NL676_039878 [Syzygium grande]
MERQFASFQVFISEWAFSIHCLLPLVWCRVCSFQFLWGTTKWNSIAACCRTRVKMARLRQAKEEAEKEIIAFHAQMEGEFQRKVAESSEDSGANVKRLEQQMVAKVAHLKTEATRISQDVV